MTNYARFFERKTRDSGETFYSLSDDRPDWLYDAVRDAHDGELPDDWRYDVCHSIVSAIDEGNPDEFADNLVDIVDGLVDVYTSDLLRWLSDDVSRTAYVDEFATDLGGAGSVEELVRGGQYLAIERMAQILIDAIAESADDAHYVCDVCGTSGTVDDLCEDGGECPDEGCTGTTHRID